MNPSFSVLFVRGLVAAAVSLLVAWPAGARTLLVFGDSLSAAYGISPDQGWVHLLGERAARVDPQWRVVNASVSGETTDGGLRRLSADLERHKPSMVVIALGANDALRGQPIAGIRDNLEKMIRLARQARAEPVLVGIMIPPNYGIDYADQFRQVYPALAKSDHVPLVPFLLEGIADKPDLFQADQLHPTAAAQKIILDNVWKTLGPLLRKPAS
jgi:acyl-CoA thioesterase-1